MKLVKKIVSTNINYKIWYRLYKITGPRWGQTNIKVTDQVYEIRGLITYEIDTSYNNR